MQFKHPEVFYFLLLLLIPILVHLFQLQKFKKVAFTNVSFLKKISLETRKSSRLKKWLILSTRLLGLLALLFTFSQPYFSSKKVEEKNHNFVYLDNSMSLNTNGSNGNKLRIATQELIENSSELDEYTLLTNDEIYRDLTKKEFEELLKNVPFSSKKGNLEQKLLEIESQKNTKSKTLYKNILISDFQHLTKSKNTKFTDVNSAYSLVKLKNSQQNNVSIDSMFISNNTADEINISFVIKNQGGEKKDIPVALYDDENLINKRSFSIEKDNVKNIEFSIPKTTNFKGKIQITFDDIFLFDNTFFFSINSQQKTQVLSIGNDSDFLSRIFTQESFDFSSSSLQNVNYNTIPEQQLIVLNQLKNIPNVLQNSLVQFLKEGGHLLIIPDKEINISSYNTFFRLFANGSINEVRKDSLKITKINFDHPLYTNVFSKRVSNFQFPSVAYQFTNTLQGDQIISYENNRAFLQEISNPYSEVYWFSSPLDSKTTNFTNSPLIVPTIFNIGQRSLEVSKPFYTLQEENIIEINKKIQKDEILTISNEAESFIPLQQSYPNKVKLTTKEKPILPGFYEISLKEQALETIAYNISNEESSLDFYSTNELTKANENFKVYDSIEELFTEINQKNEVQWLWKLFLAIAIVSLLLEILILKFFRT